MIQGKSVEEIEVESFVHAVWEESTHPLVNRLMQEVFPQGHKLPLVIAFLVEDSDQVKGCANIIEISRGNGDEALGVEKNYSLCLYPRALQRADELRATLNAARRSIGFRESFLASFLPGFLRDCLAKVLGTIVIIEAM